MEAQEYLRSPAESAYELQVLPEASDASALTPRTLSAQSSMVALRAGDPKEGVNVQELAPVDRGVQAWTFCFAGFVLEMMVWGFGFRSVPHPVSVTRWPRHTHLSPNSYGIFQGTSTLR